MDNSKLNSPWVLLEIKKIVYAVSCEVVLSLSQLPFVTPIPKTPTEVRGVVDFRGRTIELLDSRVMLGLPSVSEEVDEFIKAIDQYYQDYKEWFNTLESSVKNGESFTLITDPDKSAFGKWYYGYSAESENMIFMSTFAKFDKPHREIHNAAAKTQDLIRIGKNEDAINLLDLIKKTEFKQIISLFEDIKAAYKDSRKEIMVVIGNEQKRVGMSVDQITSIESLTEIDEDLIKSSVTNSQYLVGYGKRKNDKVAIILNEEYILSKFH